MWLGYSEDNSEATANVIPIDTGNRHFTPTPFVSSIKEKNLAKNMSINSW
jgi:hypothetical protein